MDFLVVIAVLAVAFAFLIPERLERVHVDPQAVVFAAMLVFVAVIVFTWRSVF